MPKETTKSIGLEGKSKAPDFRRGNNYVLCIGIDDYEKQPLHNCVRDVKAFTQVLIERYDFKEEHITYLLNREATREEINDRLRAYADLITEEDNFLLYYSGHGKFDKLEDEGYWLTYGCDFKNYANKGIANQEMVRKIKTLKARHIVLFIDSCFSGSLFFTDKDLVAASPPDELEKDPSR
nr:caspase family protein [Saprospiraceae bacterium]